MVPVGSVGAPARLCRLCQASETTASDSAVLELRIWTTKQGMNASITVQGGGGGGGGEDQ